MRQRKSYPKSFKNQVVQECAQPGVSVAAIAIRHGINPNVVRRWIPLYRDQQAAALPAFIPMKVTPVEPKQKIGVSAIIELPLGEQSITVKWPTSDPDGCARFVRGLAL
ncbi:IS66-like element accessory protein TnpA [Pseudomonas sp. A-B-26]|jgi:transposase-like protein|uniref:IS66-like element accessory protein TnpA n=1 Tax=Pseudomonas sp. A-B-26 TaxID=2832406 RepID=UPI001CBAC863|nr:transposase [Pseudomonas sp. A-B-26]